MANKLYQFEWDCGRAGSVEGLFVADEQTVEAAIGSKVSFGEILGKHSDVFGTLDQEDLEEIDIPSEALDALVQKLGYTWSGYNPLEHIQEG